ncbi:MAG: efflux RND transporter periplasmic adaptor subunit, partial [Thiobacillus sp.]|nr:efflux RND transporter periplasmic adaptor subunit [Thiobacillus sp.]
MNGNLKLVAALVAGLAGGAGAVYLALKPATHPAGTPAAATAPAQKILYWYDPMVPDQHFDKGGKSPFMDMDLVPKYADEDTGAGVKIDPRTSQSLGVRTAVAETGRLWRRIDTVGTVKADDNRVEMLQTRVGGWLEALHIHAVNDPVRKGQLVAEVYSPELYAAQEEFLLALKHPEDTAWRSAARQKLAFLGLAEGQIAGLEKTGKSQRRVAYYAPAGGIVSNIAVHPGAAVTAGMPLMEITDLGRVWVTADVVENELSWIMPGKSAEIGFNALPGETFEGRIDYIGPKLDPATRTVPVRIVLNNPGLKLKPGMYANITLFGGKGEEGVVVPSEAVIQTGKRAVVLIAEAAGRFRPVEVKTGMESDGKTLILDGLAGGEKLVVSGQFLIESEANLKGALERMKPAGGATWGGTARIVAADPKTGALTMEHDPIPALKWPAMTMDFKVAAPALLNGLKKGQAVEFD